MKQESTVRQRFERWYSDDGKSPRAIERDGRGGYLLMQAESAWATWQAADEAAQAAYGATDAPEPEPFWYAVISEKAPVINKAIRSAEVAEEHAQRCRDLGYPGVEVVPLYRAALSSAA